MTSPKKIFTTIVDKISFNDISINNVRSELSLSLNTETNDEIANLINNLKLNMTSHISNNNYYVPVTKYVNDDREKINIIIDNLSSSYIYEGNLSSYLRSDIDVLEYKNDNSIMEINFNKDIFPSDKLLEAVEYTLSYSIFDNYEVDKIVLKVNGVDLKEIDKCSIYTSCMNEWNIYWWMFTNVKLWTFFCVC